MATGTNGIATEGEAKEKVIGPRDEVTIVTNKCCTKERLITIGGRVDGYESNQSVKYSDIKQGFIINVFNKTNENTPQEKFYLNFSFDRNLDDYVVINGIRNSFSGPGAAGLYINSDYKLMFNINSGDVAAIRLPITSSYTGCFVGIGTLNQLPISYDILFQVRWNDNTYDLVHIVKVTGYTFTNQWYNINKGLG